MATPCNTYICYISLLGSSVKSGTVRGSDVCINYRKYCKLSKEVLKSNFQQYGEMEKQRWEQSQKRKEEERRSENRKTQKKEDGGAREKVESRKTRCLSNVLWLRRVEK